MGIPKEDDVQGMRVKNILQNQYWFQQNHINNMMINPIINEFIIA